MQNSQLKSSLFTFDSSRQMFTQLLTMFFSKNFGRTDQFRKICLQIQRSKTWPIQGTTDFFIQRDNLQGKRTRHVRTISDGSGINSTKHQTILRWNPTVWGFQQQSANIEPITIIAIKYGDDQLNGRHEECGFYSLWKLILFTTCVTFVNSESTNFSIDFRNWTVSSRNKCT